MEDSKLQGANSWIKKHSLILLSRMTLTSWRFSILFALPANKLREIAGDRRTKSSPGAGVLQLRKTKKIE